ncbi:hypothetical protein SAMN06265222_10958 [Neorhodopirellula lusitana]|uniref:SSD domain-containing protein n=1 Tax=Neorhodopirellula lusitana TaxID=445327 RepID=A0ABY1QD14_9BACT|nr:MMPL family transporter [Neorhodopirellula lusitana]SMP65479.1 hypothetical protein SAMN06265222_10958 [Neorhodopirellula lusitana]
MQSGLQVNRQLASMFAPDDPSLADYQNLQATFGGNQVIMLVYDDPDLMSQAGLHRCRKWTHQVESLEAVTGVLSVAKLVDVFAYLRPKLPFSSDDSIALFDLEDELAQEFRELFAGYTHSRDESTSAIVAMLGPDNIQGTLTDFRQIVAQMNTTRPLAKATLVGEPILLQDAFDLILADGRRLAIGTISLLALVILVTLGDIRVVVLSAISITWSTLATRSTMVLLGIELSLVSAVLIAIVAVIVVAAVMHLGIRRRSGVSTIQTIGLLAIPITVTCLTDAAGFASLLVSGVRPVQQFGIMTAVASLAVLASLALFTPAILSWPDRLRIGSRMDARLPGRTSDLLRRTVRMSLRHRSSLGIAMLLVILVCGLHVATLTTNTSFLQNFRSDSEIATVYRRVEERLGGAGVTDIVLPAPNAITPEYLDRVLAFEQRLRDLRVGTDGQAQLSKVLSLADADAVAAKVSFLSFVTPDVRLAGMRAAIPEFAQALLTFPASPAKSTRRSLRIMLRSDEAMSGPNKAALSRAITHELAAFAAWNNFTDSDRPRLTGYSVLMSNLVASLIRDQWRALGLACVLVGTLLWLATGNWRETLAALLVNTLPIVVVLSLMGLLGGQLDLGSAMIGAVSIGMSIDGSVHFLTGYHRRRRSGSSTHDAAVESATDLGLPIVLASLALVVGFGVLVTSPFVPTATFGLLVAATLAASTVANLTLLPAMVVWCTSQECTVTVPRGESESDASEPDTDTCEPKTKV